MTFDRTYEESRGELYTALALATGSRDLAADTVDDGFRMWHSRVLRRRLPSPPKAAVLSEAMRRLARMTSRGSEPQEGFRRRTTPAGDGDRQLLREFRSLALEPRMALVLVRHLEWDPPVVAAATGVPPADLEAVVAATIERLGRAIGVDAADAAVLLDAALAAEATELREPLSRAPGTRSAGIAQRVAKAIGGVALAGGLAVAAVLGVAAIDFGSSSTTSVPGSAISTSEGVAVSPPVSGPTSLTETRFDWVSSALPIAPNNGDIRSVSAVGSDIVLVGMEYGNRPQAVVARSSDGLEWEFLPAPFVGEGDITDIAMSGDRMVAAGNRWDAVGPSVSVWISEDGSDWIESQLPVEESAMIQGVEVRVFAWVRDVEIAGDDIIVTLDANAEFDERFIAQLVPGGFGDGGWGTSNDGIQVFDRSGNPFFFSWEELGMSEEEVALLSARSRVLISSDGGTSWTEDGGQLPGNLLRVTRGPRMTAAVVFDLFGPELLVRDGEEWKNIDLALTVSDAVAFGEWLYVSGFTADGGSAMWRTTDGDDWQVVLEGVGSGQLGLSASASGLMLLSTGGGFGVATPVELDIDGFRVQVFQTGGIRVLDPETDEVVAELPSDRVFMGGDVFVVEDADGEPILELHPLDIEQAFGFGEGADGAGGSDQLLFVSANGADWQRVALDGELPDSLNIFTSARVGDGVALLGWDDRGDGQQLWIGTPPT